MSRAWNGKALIDYLGVRLWDNSSTFRSYIIDWVNEIQDDIISELPIEVRQIKAKKLLPTGQDIINLNLQIPSAPTLEIATGGSLVDGSSYKVYTTFLMYDDDTRNYIESEPIESEAVVADATNKTINITDIDLYDGSAVSPLNIRRRIYLSTLTSGDTAYSEPFFVQDIIDNTTTTLSITAEPISTITPPSSSEIDQLSSKQMYFNNGLRWLEKTNSNTLIRNSVTVQTSTTPSYFDYIGTDSIRLYPQLSADATTAQRTLTYFIIRRAHEIFYDINRPIDLPITARKALIQGVIWKAYDYRDRSGKESELSKYENFKIDFLQKMTRRKGKPNSIRDVNGDVFGFGVN